MEIKIKKKFLKELSKLSNEYADTIEKFVFDILPTYDNLSESGKVEKMTGYKNYFKIRFGDYIVGICQVSPHCTISKAISWNTFGKILNISGFVWNHLWTTLESNNEILQEWGQLRLI